MKNLGRVTKLWQNQWTFNLLDFLIAGDDLLRSKIAPTSHLATCQDAMTMTTKSSLQRVVLLWEKFENLLRIDNKYMIEMWITKSYHEESRLPIQKLPKGLIQIFQSF